MRDDGLAFWRGCINALAMMLLFVVLGLAAAGQFLPLGFGLAAAFGFFVARANATGRVVYLDSNTVARIHARAARRKARVGARGVGDPREVPSDPTEVA